MSCVPVQNARWRGWVGVYTELLGIRKLSSPFAKFFVALYILPLKSEIKGDKQSAFCRLLSCGTNN